ncbi:MAG: hypothetical protein U0R65_14845 [Candidatus Nanopelagicales bacterium]
MRRGAATTWLAVAAALVAGALSVGRLLLANGSALSTLVWAEDGLFPLCVRAHNVASCAVDPYSGYLLLVPRLVAWPVSLVPMDSWPMATNVAAAVLAALLAALAVVVLRAGGSGGVAAVVVALLPTLVPIMAFEAINVTASVYMLLVFVAALAVSFPPRGRFPTWAYAVGAILVALTIPSSAILLLPLAVSTLRGRIPRRGAVVTAVALVLGLVAQGAATVLTANPRPMHWSIDALRSWADTLPSGLLTFWPGQTELTATGSFASSTVGWTQAGIVIAAVVLVLGIVLVAVRGATANGVGLLLLTGLFLGAVPAAAGYANNRYFVIPALLWLAALLVGVDRVVAHREIVLAVVTVVLVAAWVPGLRASDFRSTATPEWAPMMAAARAQCAGNPEGTVAITFSPSWPFADAVFPGPTNNVVPCAVLR